jgi:hypothetical protein
MKKLKAAALCTGFLAMGYSLATHEPHGITMAFDEMHINRVTMGIAFCISSLMIGVTGILGWRWNTLWIAIFILYTGVSMVALMLPNPSITPTSVIAYAILSVYLIADMVSEETWSWRNPLKW